MTNPSRRRPPSSSGKKKGKAPTKAPGISARAAANPIRRLLLAGHPVAEVQKRLKITTERIYEYANEHSLPVNPPVKPGSAKQKQILDCYRDFGARVTLVVFRLAPAALRRIQGSTRKPRTKTPSSSTR